MFLSWEHSEFFELWRPSPSFLVSVCVCVKSTLNGLMAPCYSPTIKHVFVLSLILQTVRFYVDDSMFIILTGGSVFNPNPSPPPLLQVWRRLLELSSNQWRSWLMSWSWQCFASVSLLWLVCSSSWETCGKNVSWCHPCCLATTRLTSILTQVTMATTPTPTIQDPAILISTSTLTIQV